MTLVSEERAGEVVRSKPDGAHLTVLAGAVFR
jgi:hypothetical protein